MKLIILILLFSFGIIFSQAENDTIIDLNNLPEYNPEDFEPDFHINSKTGWFPAPEISYFSYGFSFGFHLMNYETEKAISSASFAAPFEFSGEDIMTNNQKKIDKKNKKEQYNNYPHKISEYYSLISKIAIKNFTWLRFDLSYHIYRGVLMHRLEDKYFFPVGENELKKIKEVALIYNTDHGINLALGFEVPLWGGMVNRGGSLTESFYYLYGGFSSTRVISSEAKQFYQLATYNNEIRYRNGKDTIGIGSNKLSTLNYTRNFIDLGIGATIHTNAAGFSVGSVLQLIYSYPLTSVISDANWKQHMLRFDIQIYFKGFIEDAIRNRRK